MIEFALIPGATGQSISWVVPEGLGDLAVISVSGDVTYDGSLFGSSFPVITVYAKGGDRIFLAIMSDSQVGNLDLFRYSFSLQNTSAPWGYGTGSGDSWASAGFGPIAWQGGETIEVGMLNAGNHSWSPVLMQYAWQSPAAPKPKTPRPTSEQIGYGCKLYKR